jgi:hypothetical protein
MGHATNSLHAVDYVSQCATATPPVPLESVGLIGSTRHLFPIAPDLARSMDEEVNDAGRLQSGVYSRLHTWVAISAVKAFG